MLIGLVGLIGSGKDTVAERLVSHHGFKRDSFAQSLKDARPARVEPLTVFVGGAGFFDYDDSMKPATNKKQPTVVSSIGTVTVSTS